MVSWSQIEINFDFFIRFNCSMHPHHRLTATQAAKQSRKSHKTYAAKLCKIVLWSFFADRPQVCVDYDRKCRNRCRVLHTKQNETKKNEKDVAVDLLQAPMLAQTHCQHGRASAIIARQCTSSAIKLWLLPYSAGVGRVSSMRAGMLVVSKTIVTKLFWQRTQYGGAFAS